MCKYCSRLKQLNERDYKNQERLIRYWRRKSGRQDVLLSECLDVIDVLNKYCEVFSDGSKCCVLPDIDKRLAHAFFVSSDLSWRLKYYFQFDRFCRK